MTASYIGTLSKFATFDIDQPCPYVPRLLRKLKNEDRQFSEDVEKARQELPRRAAARPRLRHQQVEPALQGAPGLSSAVFPGHRTAMNPEPMNTDLDFAGAIGAALFAPSVRLDSGCSPDGPPRNDMR